MRIINEVNGSRSLSALKFQNYTYNQSAISAEHNMAPLMVSSLQSSQSHLGKMEPPFFPGLYFTGRDIKALYAGPLE